MCCIKHAVYSWKDNWASASLFFYSTIWRLTKNNCSTSQTRLCFSDTVQRLQRFNWEIICNNWSRPITLNRLHFLTQKCGGFKFQFVFKHTIIILSMSMHVFCIFSWLSTIYTELIWIQWITIYIAYVILYI